MNFIRTAFSGMQATQAHLNATSMNIANMHTPVTHASGLNKVPLAQMGRGALTQEMGLMLMGSDASPNNMW